MQSTATDLLTQVANLLGDARRDVRMTEQLNRQCESEIERLRAENEALRARVSRAEDAGTIENMANMTIDQLKQYCADIIKWEHDAKKREAELMRYANELRDFIRRAPVSSGVCVCGEDICSHTLYSGHSPVDEWDYRRDKILSMPPSSEDRADLPHNSEGIGNTMPDDL